MSLSLFRSWAEWSGLSQVEIAKLLGCSQPKVSRIIGAGHSPDLATAIVIERVTKEFERDGEAFPSGPVPANGWTGAEEPAVSQ